MTLSATETHKLKQAPLTEEVLPVFHTRWSPRSFSDREVSSADLRKVFEAARWAPSSNNEQPWRFIVGRRDSDGLIKPMAYVVPAGGFTGTDDLAQQLKAHVKSRLAPYKYPRWIEFVAELPKTATGKIQRFKLRS